MKIDKEEQTGGQIDSWKIGGWRYLEYFGVIAHWPAGNDGRTQK